MTWRENSQPSVSAHSTRSSPASSGSTKPSGTRQSRSLVRRALSSQPSRNSTVTPSSAESAGSESRLRMRTPRQSAGYARSSPALARTFFT